jgi:hypothetical protein
MLTAQRKEVIVDTIIATVGTLAFFGVLACYGGVKTILSLHWSIWLIWGAMMVNLILKWRNIIRHEGAHRSEMVSCSGDETGGTPVVNEKKVDK